MAKYMTAKKVAVMLDVCYRTVLRMIHNGEFRGVIDINGYRIPEKSVNKYLKNKKVNLLDNSS